MPDKKFLTPEELASRWGHLVTVNTLNQWRYERKGPPYKKIVGKVVYPLEEIEKYEKTGIIHPE